MDKATEGQRQILGGFSESTASLDKLLDPMDSVTSQPGCCLQTSASIEGFLQPTRSLDLSGVKLLPDCEQVLLGFWMEMWPAGHWTLPTAIWTQPFGPLAQS